jgi:hypothetical protein
VFATVQAMTKPDPVRPAPRNKTDIAAEAAAGKAIHGDTSSGNGTRMVAPDSTPFRSVTQQA